MWSVNNLFKYSEFNLNSLPVYVTEFGYDSEGGGDDCVHSVCISEELQAIYGIRMSLILYRLGVNEFYWYYYANVDGDSFLHNRSGLLSSYSKGMQIKKSFIAFETLQKHIGDMVFTGILSETNDLYVYSFEDKTNNTKALVAWIPTSGNHLKSEWVDIVHEYRASTTIPVIETEKYKVTGFVNTVDGTRVNLCGIPVIIYIQ